MKTNNVGYIMNDSFEIHGGVPLCGSVAVRAAKNAVLPMMAAALLASDGIVRLQNVPDIADLRTMIEVLECLGARVVFDRQSSELSIDATAVSSTEAPYHLVNRMRASFVVMGPLLARFNEARVSQPGGCAIGSRPIDQHLRGFARLGANIIDEHGFTVARARDLHGANVFFDRPTHTGTENVLMAATLARGRTTLFNAAQDPEVADLARLLNAMGAKVSFDGGSKIIIDGVESLHGADFCPIGDRLEAGTYLCATMCAGGSVRVLGIDPEHLAMPLFKLEEMGARVALIDGGVSLEAPKVIQPVNIVTDPYPGFPTDLQPQFIAALSLARGVSNVWERIFEHRFIFVNDLLRLGAQVTHQADRATIEGVATLEGARVEATDIRAGAGLIAACLGARGVSIIEQVRHIDRGYEGIERRLGQLGAKIVRRELP